MVARPPMRGGCVHRARFGRAGKFVGEKVFFFFFQTATKCCHLKWSALSRLLNCGLQGAGVTQMVRGSSVEVRKGDFCLKRCSFSRFSLELSCTLGMERGSGAFSSESQQGAHWAFLCLFSCHCMSHMLASSS